MKAFDLLRPASLDEALAALQGEPERGRVAVLAGGQDLLTELKEHLVEPDVVVDLARVPGLDGLEWGDDGSLSIGAKVRLFELEEDARVRADLAVLSEAAASVASPQIRSVGTVGGNLNQRPRCWYYRDEHAVCTKKGGPVCLALVGENKYNAILGGGPSFIVHPSDLAPALVALDAEVVLRSAEGERRLPLERYFTLPSEGDVTRETVLRPGELLTRVVVPAPPAGLRSTYLKFKERESYDWALASVAACLAGDAEASHARLVLGGVAPKPWRVPGAEAALLGRALDAAAIAAAAEAALAGAEPLSGNAYKVPLAKGLVTRALRALNA